LDWSGADTNINIHIASAFSHLIATRSAEIAGDDEGNGNSGDSLECWACWGSKSGSVRSVCPTAIHLPDDLYFGYPSWHFKDCFSIDQLVDVLIFYTLWGKIFTYLISFFAIPKTSFIYLGFSFCYIALYTFIYDVGIIVIIKIIFTLNNNYQKHIFLNYLLLFRVYSLNIATS